MKSVDSLSLETLPSPVAEKRGGGVAVEDSFLFFPDMKASMAGQSTKTQDFAHIITLNDRGLGEQKKWTSGGE
jgi:hypothetical protein